MSGICTRARARRWRCWRSVSATALASLRGRSSRTCGRPGRGVRSGSPRAWPGWPRAARVGSSCCASRWPCWRARRRCSSARARWASWGLRCAGPAGAPTRASRSPRRSSSLRVAAPVRSPPACARSWARSASGRVASGEPGSEALTPGELRVARLAAEGQTNREIAQALYVTLKTVEGHLARAYAKLGIAGRAGLADALAEEKTRVATP